MLIDTYASGSNSNISVSSVVPLSSWTSRKMAKRSMTSLAPYIDPTNYTLTPYWAYGVGFNKVYDPTILRMEHYIFKFNADGTGSFNF